MGPKTSSREDPDFNNDLHIEWFVEADNESSPSANTETTAARNARQNLLKHTPVTQCGPFHPVQFPWDMSGSFSPGHEQPGIFFDSSTLPARLPVAAHLKEENVNQEKVADDFHDSDAEDVFDLYLAVDGALHNGLLDIRKLDQLTPEESEILNVTRLREIWSHTKTGCLKCKEIIRTLNIVRDVLREQADNSFAEQTKVELVDQADRSH